MIAPAATCRSRPWRVLPLVCPSGAGAGVGETTLPRESEELRDHDVDTVSRAAADATTKGFFLSSGAESGRDDERRESRHFLEAFALEGVDMTPRAITIIFPLSLFLFLSAKRSES